MDPRLQDIYNQLESVYQPQRAALQQQVPLYEQQAAASRAALEQARANAFRDISSTAQQRGMLFSGFAPEQQAQYTGTKYLPALAGVEQSLQQRKMNLEQQLNQLNVAQRQSAQDILSKQLAAEEAARQREIDRQLKVQLARMSIAARSAGRGMSEAEKLQYDIASMQNRIQQNKDLQYKSAQGTGYLSPASYKDFKNQWLAAGRKASDFEANFAQYANPTHLWDYGIKSTQTQAQQFMNILNQAIGR